jgi:hypothetical protein
MWRNGDDIILLSIHVDDGIMISNNAALFDEFLRTLLEHVQKAVMYENPRKFLGMEIVPQSDGRVMLRQKGYVEEHFSDFTKPTRTPMSNATNLRQQKSNPVNASLLEDTGRFRFLADRTRPDLLASVGEVSRGGDKAPSDLHLQVSRRIKNFLTTSKDRGLILGGKDAPQLFAYCDAAYVTDGDAKCRLGGALFIGEDSGAIATFSRTSVSYKKPKDSSACDEELEDGSALSHSSTEAEIKAIDEMVRLIEHWLEVLRFTEIEVKTPVKIFVDNKSAIELCRVMKTTHAVKHINMRIRYIHEMINNGAIGLYFVPSELNVADILTKPLPNELFERHGEILLCGHGGDLMSLLEKHSVNIVDMMRDAV